MNPLDEADRHRLLTYHWPGNVRELQNIIERGIITQVKGKLNLTALISIPVESPNDKTSPNRILTEPEMLALEKTNIIRALTATNWKISGDNGAAQLLQLPSTTLSSRIGKLGIKKDIK
jgi:transcriptional regulator with GAF, ATPase, and Fis domain